MIKSAHRFLGNRATNAALLSRVVQVSGWVICTPAIAKLFTKQEQGFHYTFASLLALQIVLEAGVGTVVMQMVAHEFALLDGAIGESRHGTQLARLAAICRFSVKWFAVVALSAMVCIFIAGCMFFQSTSHQDSTVRWLLPWAAACLGLGISIASIGVSAFLEGMGFVAEVAFYRSVGALTGSAMFVGILYAGGALFATAANITIPAVIGVALAFNKIGPQLRTIWRASPDRSFSWFKEAGSFQVKMAISWLSGWIIFQLMMPVAFKRFGAAEAGRYGLALQIANGIQSIAGAWCLTKQSPWGQYVAQGRRRELVRECWRAMTNATVVAIVLSAVGLGVIEMIQGRFSIADRLPTIGVCAFLFTAAAANQIVFTEAVYLRAHKQEPFIYISVAFAAAMLLALNTAMTASPQTMAATYALLTVIIGVGGGTAIFSAFRKRLETPAKP